MKAKSLTLAVGLATLFGPVGLLYTDRRMGLTMIGAAFVLFFVTLMPFTNEPALLPMRVIAWAALMMACIVMSVTDTLYFNSTIDRE